MSKHPTDRSQRLRLKKLKYEKKQKLEGHEGGLRHQRELEKERETDDELQAAYRGTLSQQL